MVSTNFPQKGAHVRRKADGMIGEVYASDPYKDILTVLWRTGAGNSTQVCSSGQFAHDWEIKSMTIPEKLDAFSKNLAEIAKALLMIGLGLLGMVFFWPKSCGSESTQQATTESQLPSENQLNDAKYLDDHYGVGASIGCADGADEYLRSVAKWDFKWDEIGTLEAKFDKYRAYVKSSGILTSVSKKAKLQNGFGAFQHITLTCDYDTQAKKVVGYNIER